MKLNTISLIAIISLVVFGAVIFGFFGVNNKLLNLRFAHKQNIEPDSQLPVPMSERAILLLLVVGIIGALSARRKNKTSRSASQTKSPPKSDHLESNTAKVTGSRRYFELGESHIQTLYELRNAVCGYANFIILTGDSGTGKGKLIKYLKKEIYSEYIIIEIGNEFQDAKDLFMLIAAQTGINSNFTSKGAFFIRFNQYLHTLQAESKKILFIVEDLTAKNEKLFKELTFLSNITIRQKKIIKILISGENISYGPDEPYKPINSSVFTLSLKRLNRSETKGDINYIPEKDGTKNSIFQQETIQNNTLDPQIISVELNKVHDHKLNFVNEQELWTTISLGSEKCSREFNRLRSGQENNYRKISQNTGQITAFFDNFLKRFAALKLFDQSIYFAGIIKQLLIKQLNYGRTIFFIAVRFDSLLWNSVLSISLFSVTLLLALWYQGVLPLKPDASKSENYQKKIYSQEIDQKIYRDKEIIKSSEQLTIRARKQFSTDQKLSEVDKQNELKLKLPIKELEVVKATYFVQVGAFLIEGNAIKTKRKLKEKGYYAKIVTVTDSKDRLWHTVRIGEYSSLKFATKHAAEFSNQEKLDSIVLPLKHH